MSHPASTTTISKPMRILKVLEIVARLKRATPEDVMRSLANSLAISEITDGFKRSIYRDLKELAHDGRLMATHFSPDGAEIDVDLLEHFSNIRVEYSIPHSDSVARGAGLLEKAGGCFRAVSPLVQSWAIEQPVPNLKKGFTHLFFETAEFAFLCLKVRNDELPVSILVARRSDELDALDPRFLKEKFGQRLGVLSLNHRTLSGYSAEKRAGHALITLSADGKVTVTDLNSSNGSAVSDAGEDFLADICSPQTAAITRDENDGITAPGQASPHRIFTTNQWKMLQPSTSSSLPLALRLGSVMLIAVSDLST